jgi:hypothetical protein
MLRVSVVGVRLLKVVEANEADGNEVTEPEDRSADDCRVRRGIYCSHANLQEAYHFSLTSYQNPTPLQNCHSNACADHLNGLFPLQ